MCLGYPARVVSLEDGVAGLRVDGLIARASTLLVPTIQVGDWVTVANGSILRVLDPAQAADIHAMLDAAIARTKPPEGTIP